MYSPPLLPPALPVSRHSAWPHLSAKLSASEHIILSARRARCDKCARRYLAFKPLDASIGNVGIAISTAKPDHLRGKPQQVDTRLRSLIVAVQAQTIVCVQQLLFPPTRPVGGLNSPQRLKASSPQALKASENRAIYPVEEEKENGKTPKR